MSETVNPLVSVIIPVFNVAPYLKEALNSVINQTYENFKIILIDDGSTDGSGAICDEYRSEPRITVIHQTHHGVSSARNAGLDIATGDYIAFLDPDDAFDPSFIQRMLDVMQIKRCDIAVCKYKVYYTDYKMDVDKGAVALSPTESGDYNRTQALHGLLDGKLNMAIWNKLYKRDLWKNVRFRTDLIAASDHVVSFQVFDRCNSVYVIDKPLYFYRVRQKSISRNFSTKNVECQVLARSLVTDFLKTHSPADFSEKQIKKYELSRLRGMIYYYSRCQDSAFSECQKKQIIEMEEKIGIENCDLKTRAAYYMMQQCSWLFKRGCSVYSQISLFVRKVFSR